MSDILKLLESLPIWRKVVRSAEAIEALEKRVAVLEAELARRPPPEECPLCRKALRLDRVELHSYSNAEFHHFVCDSDGCPFPGRTRTVDP